jgi:hypothetical protein
MRSRREGSGNEPDKFADSSRIPFNLYLDTAPVVENVSSQLLRAGKVVDVRAESHALDDAFDGDPASDDLFGSWCG